MKAKHAVIIGVAVVFAWIGGPVIDTGALIAVGGASYAAASSQRRIGA